MAKLTEKQKQEAAKDLEIYFGKPPYELEIIRARITSGLFEEQALAKYGLTPIELIHEVSKITLTEKQKQEAFKNCVMYFGPPPVTEDVFDRRLSSGLLEVQILAKYLMTLKDLMKEIGYMVTKK